MNLQKKTILNKPILKSVHPFPARMAAEIAFERLSRHGQKLKVLDPMMGSGTTIAIARKNGHEAVGFDTDPLAVLISKVLCSNVNEKTILLLAKDILEKAKKLCIHIKLRKSYPKNSQDDDSKKFIRYWFDKTNRKQLYSLSKFIGKVENENNRNILWCAFSKMIIKKKDGVSLAMDVSHSRPHKTTNKSKVNAFDLFEKSLKQVLHAMDSSIHNEISPKIYLGDARNLPLENKSFDIVITSPPYLNAIDYMRGHRLSLVWMGYSISKLRTIRSTNIGTESNKKHIENIKINRIINKVSNKKKLPKKLESIVKTYINDLMLMMYEVYRVLKDGGLVTFVIGNSSTQGVFIKNSLAIEKIAKKLGFKLQSSKIRKLPANKRYLPPPSSNSGIISNRMRTETLLTFLKPLKAT